MHMRIQGAHGLRQVFITGHRRMSRAMPHKHHILMRAAFRRQMADERQGRFGHVLRVGQQGRAHMADKALLRGYFIHGGADLGMLAPRNGLKRLHRHLGELFKTQAAQCLEHGVAFLPRSGQAFAQQQRGIRPAHRHTRKTRAHTGVKTFQGALALGVARAESHQKNCAFHTPILYVIPHDEARPARAGAGA